MPGGRGQAAASVPRPLSQAEVARGSAQVRLPQRGRGGLFPPPPQSVGPTGQLWRRDGKDSAGGGRKGGDGFLWLRGVCVCSEHRSCTNAGGGVTCSFSPPPPTTNPSILSPRFLPGKEGEAPSSPWEAARVDPLGRTFCRCLRQRPGKADSLYLPGNSERDPQRARRASAPQQGEGRAGSPAAFARVSERGSAKGHSCPLPPPSESRGDFPTQLSTSPPPEVHSQGRG